MPNGSLTAGTATKMPEIPTPEVGQVLTLHFAPYGGIENVHGDRYFSGGTYIEVEIKAVRKAKVVLE